MNKPTRWIIIFTLVSLLVLAAASVASADAPAKGDVTAISIGDHNVTLDTKSGAVVVTLPADFEIDSVALGDYLMAKGIWVSASELTADWVKVFPANVDKTDDDEDEDEDEGEKPDKEEKQFNNAYCTGEKEGFHPLAEKFAEGPAVSAEQVHAWFCEGNSIGAIMLALMTEEMGGAPAGETLAERNSGTSWGKIWKVLGFIGKEEDAMPPGQLKKQDGKIPPGQMKKTPQP